MRGKGISSCSFLSLREAHAFIDFSFSNINVVLLDSSAKMIEVILNDRLGRKIRVKCNPDDTVGDLKKLVAAQCGKEVKIRRVLLCSIVRGENDI